MQLYWAVSCRVVSCRAARSLAPGDSGCQHAGLLPSAQQVFACAEGAWWRRNNTGSLVEKESHPHSLDRGRERSQDGMGLLTTVVTVGMKQWQGREVHVLSKLDVRIPCRDCLEQLLCSVNLPRPAP